MGLFAKILGSENAIKGVANAARESLDALVYTDEEKATDAAKERAQARETVVRWVEATSGQRVARRLIAISVVGSWLGLWIVSVVSSITNVWAQSPELAKAVEIAGSSAESISAEVMLILGFYFAAPHLERFLPSRK